MSEFQMKGHGSLWARSITTGTESRLRPLQDTYVSGPYFTSTNLYSYYLHKDFLPHATWNWKSFFISVRFQPFSFIWAPLWWRESSSSAQRVPFAVHLHLGSVAEMRKQVQDHPLFVGCCYATLRDVKRKLQMNQMRSLIPYFHFLVGNWAARNKEHGIIIIWL